MFSGKKSLKLDSALITELQEAAKTAGYSSGEEMAENILRDHLDSVRSRLNDEGQKDADREAAEKQLRGLGYLK